MLREEVKTNEDRALANYIRIIKDTPLSDLDAKRLFTSLKDKCHIVRDEFKYMKEEHDDIVSDTLNEWMQNNSNLYK